MRQVRNEDGVKLSRSLIGSADLMLQYQKDVQKKQRIDRYMEKKKRAEARKIEKEKS